MGWNGGSELMDEIIDAHVDASLDYNTKYEIYLRIIRAFMNMDADTLDECLGRDVAYDRALREIYEDAGFGDELPAEDYSDYTDDEDTNYGDDD